MVDNVAAWGKKPAMKTGDGDEEGGQYEKRSGASGEYDAMS
jgi:hypothetical protein